MTGESRYGSQCLSHAKQMLCKFELIPHAKEHIYTGFNSHKNEKTIECSTDTEKFMSGRKHTLTSVCENSTIQLHLPQKS